MSPSPRPPSLAKYPTYLAAQLVKVSQRLLTDRLADHGLRLHHFAVLAAMSDLGSGCQQDLCDALDIDKSHMVGFVDDLETAGHVVRQRDPEDRRRYCLDVTPQGRAMLANLHQAEAECQELVFGHLSPRERQGLLDTLDKVVTVLDGERLGRSVSRDTDPVPA